MAPRVLLLLTCLGYVNAWGPDGHTIIAHIASTLLTPEVNATLNSLLGTSDPVTSLNYASDWCDDFDHSPEGAWSEGLHFVNYPGHSCSFDWATDCKDDYCNVGAIANYSKQVADASLDSATRLIALKFIIHMMGDAHQPLHVASGDDRGGNEISLGGNQFSPNQSHWEKGGNLHSQWDSALVEQDIYDMMAAPNALLGSTKKPFPIHYHQWYRITNKLEALISGDWSSKAAAWAQDMAEPSDDTTFRAGLASMANGTAVYGCQYAYTNEDGVRVKSGDTLTRAYYLRAQPIVEEQLAKGGVRLAQLLNKVLAKTSKNSPIIV